MDPLVDRGSQTCRGCDSRQLVSILDLGTHPLPSEYSTSKDYTAERFPLNLKICEICALGQIGEYVPKERIFHEAYPYFSSVSTTWNTHTRNFVEKVIVELGLDANSLVIEIASNDGGLLGEFKKKGISVLGVEPAMNVANLSQQRNIPTIIDFFGENTAKNIVKEFGHPRLVVANNVFAHVPDMQDFTKGLEVLCNNETVVTIENPSFLNLLKLVQFDTIYHEHYSYLSTYAVSSIAQKFGLKLIKIEKLPTHGGSNRYWIVLDDSTNKSIQRELDFEIENGLLNPNIWTSFATRSKQIILEFRNWLVEKESMGEVVVGFGAAHKGNTFLNAVGDQATSIKFVVDASYEKQGKYLPGTKIPVYSPETLRVSMPSNIVILPWNIKEELYKSAKSFSPNSKIWVAQPFLQQIELGPL
jgi:hypothetical protein